ncbi:hypothetical protein ACP70R_027607 [Stipagrostis hirtigluma subsp. patula]
MAPHMHYHHPPPPPRTVRSRAADDDETDVCRELCGDCTTALGLRLRCAVRSAERRCGPDVDDDGDEDRYDELMRRGFSTASPWRTSCGMRLKCRTFA